VVLFAVALFAQQQNALLITVARVTLAIACAGIAAVIPGFLHIQMQPTISTVIRAGGALAVFVLVYFFNPPGLIQLDPPPPPTADYMQVVQDWQAKIDGGEFIAAYKSASLDTHKEYSPELFVSLFQTYLAPLGTVIHRKLLGANSATALPTGEKGTFRLISYETEFSAGKKQLEQIVVKVEGNEWKVRNHTYYPVESK
jgi:hypothetical protein